MRNLQKSEKIIRYFFKPDSSTATTSCLATAAQPPARTPQSMTPLQWCTVSICGKQESAVSLQQAARIRRQLASSACPNPNYNHITNQ